MATSFTIPGNIGDFSDAQIFRLARSVANHEGELKQVEAQLKQLRAEANATKVDVKKVKAVQASRTGGTKLKASTTGLTAGPIKANGKGFTLTPGALRGTGVFYVFGAVNAIGGLAKFWNENEELRRQYGGGEVLARGARKTIGAVAGTLIEGFLESVAAVQELFGNKEARDGLARAKENLRLTLMTPAERIEREVRADRKARKFEMEETIYLEKYVPPNVLIGTTAGLQSLREYLLKINQDGIKSGAEAVRKMDFAAQD